MEAAKKQDAPEPRARVEDLTPAWARAKEMEDLGGREAKKKREEILDAGGAIGYRDDYLAIGKTSRIDGFSMTAVVRNPKLERALKRMGLLSKAFDKTPSVEKVRALSKLHPEIAKVLEEITEDAPRFEQVAKKSG